MQFICLSFNLDFSFSFFLIFNLDFFFFFFFVHTGSIFFPSLIMEKEAAGRDWLTTIVAGEKLNNLIKKIRSLSPVISQVSHF